jgi:hypothetical protein
MQTNASLTSKAFLAAIVLSGLAVMANAVLHASSADYVRFVSFLLVTCLAGRLQVKLPGLTGRMSVNLPYILVAAANLSMAEAVAIACSSTMVQCLPRAGRKFNPLQATFNVCNMALAVGATRLVFGEASIHSGISAHALVFSLATAAFFLINTVPVAIIIALTERKNAVNIWGNMFQLSFPYFVLSGAVAGLVVATSARIGWEAPLLILPVMLGVFHSYKRYFKSDAEGAPLPIAKAVAASPSAGQV